jgi:hypothetical protein
MRALVVGEGPAPFYAGFLGLDRFTAYALHTSSPAVVAEGEAGSRLILQQSL